MASLSLNTQDIYAHLGMFLAISRDSTDWDTQTTQDVQRIIRGGLRKFYGAHNWRMLEQNVTLVTAAPQTTGTVTIVDGVVTLVGSTWPATVVNNYLLVVSSQIYRVQTRNSGTQITLYDTSVDAAALTTYALYKVNYDLPSNFGGWLDPVTLENDQQLREYNSIPSWQLSTVTNAPGRIVSGRPEGFAVSQRLADEDVAVPTYFLSVYPLPDNVYTLYSRIRIQPSDGLDETATTAVANPLYGECMLEAILAAAEVYMNDTAGVHAQRFQEILQDTINKDRAMRGTQRLYPRRGSYLDPLYQLRIAPVVIE